MSWKEIKNLTPVPLEEIPILSPDDFRQQILQAVSSCCRVVQFFGEKIAEGVRLYAVMGDDRKSVLMLASTILHDSQGYRSLTPEVPMFHLFEREVYEQFGVEPIGHPWLKPVRHGIAGIHKDRRPYEFFSIKGDEVHEVGVGPIHAGIIEPGHFRFSCLGEQVEHLEIELGFQHRGVERLFVEHRDHPAYLTALSESIAGDTVIGHASAFHSAVEAL
ncbi:MAG: NADH-quinone oxidoreductase subunit C, partial [candidate division KSB1 bacterium]|nr:NADH-quinone oxidoreductase subunit C [candidate division KSB1 bacterium]